MASNDRLALGVCFSEERDLLSQWRGYADDGAGFSITFRKEVLDTLARNHEVNKLSLTKIAYGYQDHKEIKEVIKVLYDAFGEDAGRYSENGSTGIGNISVNFGPNGEKHEKYENAARALFTVKNGAFREEKEWRLFTYGDLDSLQGVKLKGTGKAIRPYIPIAIPENAVSTVTLGPTNQTPRHILKFALKNNGFYDVSVRTSSASYQAR
ncbi:DUF2971 domain-containing protein [Thioclava sp. FR2]|uniref:DUF2971 domain-containing protein n=1 Tax=Thioclava sp. FR2 TaxID=3445780 RepID=UPI003EBC6617